MDSETDTDTISLCESDTSRENYKSPESSDCEGYATPLASSLTDISIIDQGINVPDTEETTIESGERTPVSTPRARSPPIVKQTIYLQKPRILVMTQREIEEEFSEEEFFDADFQIRQVAQQLLDGVSDNEERADTPIMDLDLEDVSDTEDIMSDEEPVTPIQKDQDEEEMEVVECGSEDEEVMNIVEEVTEEILAKVEAEHEQIEQLKEDELVHAEIIDEQEEKIKDIVDQELQNDVDSGIHREEKEEVIAVEPQLVSNDAPIAETEEVSVVEEKPQVEEIETVVDQQSEDIVTEYAEDMNGTEPQCILTEETIVESTPISYAPIICDNLADDSVDSSVNNLIKECVEYAQSLEDDQNVIVATEAVHEDENDVEEPIPEETVDVLLNVESNISKVESPEPVDKQETVEVPVVEIEVITQVMQTMTSPVSVENINKITEVSPAETMKTDRPTDIFEQMPEIFSEITIANTPTIPSDERQVASNQETIENEPMTTLVNSDEVKTADDDDVFSVGSTHEVKVDFDGYSSGKEESLSSSTSSESFEFAEPVSSNHVQDEKTQALRNSIIERYPSNDTDDDDLDSVDDQFDEDLLAVKQISAEVEQLVAAINAFGRDEEQQMSAYLVGKKMAAEKKRKSAMDTGVVVTSPYHDQTVQTDNGSLILVDRHVPVAMESLQVEIDKLQADLEKVKSEETELLKINSQLKLELEESQQTIDGIEVEAEQQYTELTSEIDELCEIVQRKDQELAIVKEKVANLSVSESNLKDDVDSQRIISQRQKEIIESLREELDTITKKLSDVTKARDKAIEEATLYKMKNMERDRFLQREAQMSMEIEDLQRELNKQRLILNQTSMAKLADTFDRKVLHLENELRERDMLICKQNQIINSHRKSPTGSVITHRKMQPRASVLAAAGNLPSAGSSSESFQNGLDVEAREALLSFILSDRHNQLANIYNIGRILDLTPQEERSVERHLTKDRFT